MNLKRPPPILLACVLLAIVHSAVHSASSALAAPVAPGGSLLVQQQNPDDPPAPGGDLLTEDVRPVTFHFQLEPGFNFLDPADAQAQGTYRSGVYRDPATQLLTFVYALEAQFSSENAELAARSFAGFSTDVEARFHTEGLISRSADGSTVRTEEQSQMQAPLGEFPKVNIATDATAFDRDGSVDAFLLQRIAVFTGEPGTQGYEVRTTPLRAELALSGTLRPQAIVAAIPLPAGVWGGALLLVAAAAAAGVARIGRRMHA